MKANHRLQKAVSGCLLNVTTLFRLLRRYPEWPRVILTGRLLNVANWSIDIYATD